MSECPLCIHPERNEFEDRIGSGSLLRKQASVMLKCTVNEINFHMENHLGAVQAQTVDQEMIKLEDVFNERDILMTNVDNMLMRLDEFNRVATFNKPDTDQIVAMAAEVRKTIESLAKLDGRLKEEQHITIQHYNELKQFIFAGMCPSCQNILQQQLAVEASANQ